MLATFWSTMPLTGWTRFSLGKEVDLRLLAIGRLISYVAF